MSNTKKAQKSPTATTLDAPLLSNPPSATGSTSETQVDADKALLSTPTTPPNKTTTPTQQPLHDHDVGLIERYITAPFSSAFSSPRHTVIRILNLLLIVCMALMLWKSFVFYSGSESPIVVVLSGSMEPAFYKGDILTLSVPSEPYQIGDIVVFKIPGREIPIVHRILEIHTTTYHLDDMSPEEQARFGPEWDAETGVEGTKTKLVQKILTKGDNNDSFDRPLYMGQTWIRPDQILGKARLILPSLGHITIILTEYPLLKIALLGVMGIFVILSKE